MRSSEFIKFNPDKLQTTFVEPMTPYGPIDGRKYTLTHSDVTGELFLDVADVYNYKVINKALRDEVLGEWQILSRKDNVYRLVCNVFVNSIDFFTAFNQYKAFRDNMHLALSAIVYGDKDLFIKYPELLDSPIFVSYNSYYPMFNKTISYGYIKDFII